MLTARPLVLKSHESDSLLFDEEKYFDFWDIELSLFGKNWRNMLAKRLLDINARKESKDVEELDIAEMTRQGNKLCICLDLIKHLSKWLFYRGSRQENSWN